MFQPGRFIKQQKSTPANSFLWLLTFTDVMALMLTFFVLMFSMSHPKENSWSDFLVSLDQEFNTTYGGGGQAGVHATHEMSRKNYSKGLNLDYLSVVLLGAFENSEVLSDVEIQKFPSYLKISLPNDILFEAGKAEVTELAKTVLQPMTQIVKTLNNQIELHGHADPTPIETANYPSNWALSLARAVSFGSFLTEQGYKKSIKILGHGDKSALQLPSDMAEIERYRRSRRVDFIIHEYRNVGFSLF